MFTKQYINILLLNNVNLLRCDQFSVESNNSPILEKSSFAKRDFDTKSRGRYILF